ncbi:MAG: hypothetical protein JNL87_08605 [Burkholderiaceae bacterium]|nr:hypothetical protein [Burkholderiaceae bacterium]
MCKIAIACWLLALPPAMAAAAPVIQEVLTPAQYFECQIAARQATVQGLEQRAAQLNKAGVSDAERRAAGEMSRHRVTLALHNCGRQTASTLGAYGHRNADELQTWLNANPQVRARLDALARRVASLSAQMPAAAAPAVER